MILDRPIALGVIVFLHFASAAGSQPAATLTVSQEIETKKIVATVSNGGPSERFVWKRDFYLEKKVDGSWIHCPRIGLSGCVPEPGTRLATGGSAQMSFYLDQFKTDGHAGTYRLHAFLFPNASHEIQDENYRKSAVIVPAEFVVPESAKESSGNP